MKNLWVLIFGASLPLVGHAQSNCEALVSKMQRQESSFMKLNYAKESDRDKGSDEQSDAVDSNIEAFDRLSKNDPCRARAWKAYVNLAQAQAPFDLESGAAGVIAARLKDKSLVPVYNESVQHFPDRCRSKLLSAMVKEHQCRSAHGGEKRGGKAMIDCAGQNRKDKDYESCIGIKQGSASQRKAGEIASCDTLHKTGTTAQSRALKTIYDKVSHPNAAPADSYGLIWTDQNDPASRMASFPADTGSRSPASVQGYGRPDDGGRAPASVQ